VVASVAEMVCSCVLASAALLFFDGCREPCGEGESEEEEVGPFGVDLIERHGLEKLGEAVRMQHGR